MKNAPLQNTMTFGSGFDLGFPAGNYGGGTLLSKSLNSILDNCWDIKFLTASHVSVMQPLHHEQHELCRRCTAANE